jgi:hypothetical protein
VVLFCFLVFLFLKIENLEAYISIAHSNKVLLIEGYFSQMRMQFGGKIERSNIRSKFSEQITSSQAGCECESVS